MIDHAITTLTTLINFFHQGRESDLLQFLTEKDRAKVESASIDKTDSIEGLLPSEKALERIHYSWLIPLIQSYPDSLQSIFFSSLPDPIPQRLKKRFPSLPQQTPPSSVVRKYFNSTLYAALQDSKKLPTAFIPRTKLSPLIQCDKQKLLTIIDFLGLWDLAFEFRHVIDRSLLKKILCHLSPKKRAYLQQSVEALPPSSLQESLPLNTLNGNKVELNNLLHRKGLKRLGVALADEPESALWKIAHTLDIGRANMIQKYLLSDIKKEEITLTTSQVINVMNFLDAK